MAKTPAASLAAPLAPQEVTASFRGVLGHREFRGLWMAQLASLFGDQLARIALAVLVFDRSDNALLAALAYAVTYLPALVASPASGLLADVLPRRRVLIVCDLLRAGLVGLMCLPGLPLAALLGLLVVVYSVEAPFASARAAMLPDILAGESYPVAQSLTQVTDQFSQILGFGVGGAVIGLLSARGALAADAVTFVLSALFVRLYVRPRPAPAVRRQGHFWVDSFEGARLVLASRQLRSLLLLTVASFGTIIATEGLAVSYAAELGHGAVATGLLTAAVPAGTMLGLAAVRRWVPPGQRIPAIRLLSVFWPLPLVATVLRPPVAVSVALWALAGFLSAYQLLANVLFTQSLAPAVRGRAFAFARMLLTAVQGVGLLVFGAVALVLSPADGVAIAGLTGLGCCAVLGWGLRPIGRHRLAQPAHHSDGSSQDHFGRQLSVPMATARPARPAPVSLPTARSPESGIPGAAEATEGDVAPEPSRRRTVATYALSLAVLALATALILTGVIPHNSSFRGAVHLPWWVLLLGFLVTDAFSVHFQRGSDSHHIQLSQLTIVVGLFFGSNVGLFVARVIAGAALQGRRRLVPIKFAANRASNALEISVAAGVFTVLSPGSHFGWAALLAALASVVTADLVSALFIFCVRKIFSPGLPVTELSRPLAFLVLAGMASTFLGLLAVAAMQYRASFGYLLVFLGLLVIAGSRAYADLQERHEDLNQLYAFQDHLGALAPTTESLRPVLNSTRELLTASEVELALAPEVELSGPSGLARVLTVRYDSPLTETWRPEGRVDAEEDRSPSRLISVALVSDGRRLGTLTARDRQGQIRGFRGSDLQLLETLGTHVSDALERGRLLGKLHEAATHDPLTGLLTLTEFSHQAEEGLLRGEPLLVALLDIARLQDVNDSLGHDAGDELLRAVARRLGTLVPPHALLARSGGGEFVVGVPGAACAEAERLASQLSEQMCGLVQVLDVTVDVRTRTGWAAAPSDGRSATDLLRHADLALAFAKRGVQRCAHYTPDMEVDGLRRLRLVNDLRLAIQRREIDVVYQPLIDPRQCRVVGAEALARWTHHELGPLPPDEFVRVAEHSGLIGDLTELVLDKALAQTSAWASAGHDLRMAVNLSARCLTDWSLPGTLLDLLARHQLDPARLTLEVTETSVAEDPERAASVLARLNAMGIRLSIDDFGTGYSTLASLKRFPVHEVKLDRSFLVDLEAGLSQDLTGNAPSVDIALLTAVVTLGHSLGLEIVAEGIETQESFERLRDLGVDVLQGFLLGRPGPAELVTAWTAHATGDSALETSPRSGNLL